MIVFSVIVLGPSNFICCKSFMEYTISNIYSFCKIIVKVHYFLGYMLILKCTKLVILAHFTKYGIWWRGSLCVIYVYYVVPDHLGLTTQKN